MEITKRAYVLTPAGRGSAQARTARRANLEKARAALEARGYPQTEKRQAASRANLAKALIARRSSEGNAAARLNALQHGLFARLVPESVGRLAENPREFEDHRRRLAQVLAPEDETEREMVRRLADATWRRLRLHYAQARWEADRLREFLAAAPRAARLTAEETEQRAYALAHVLNDFQSFFAEAARLEAQIERGLRRLLRKRSDGAFKFKLLSPRRNAVLDAVDDWTTEELVERVRRLQIMNYEL